MILKKIKNYLIDNTFKMILEEDKMYIKNLKKIQLLEQKKIDLLTTKKIIHIYGNNLKMKRIVDHELLLIGQINKIEVEDAK